jgi:putative acetyltransferase
MKTHITITPVATDNPEVLKLIAKLDRYQINLYGIDNCHLDSPEVLQKSGAYMLGAFSGETLAGIGAIKLFERYAEIKRMYIEEEYRGAGIAQLILTSLEQYAKEKGKNKVCLETGSKHAAAQSLYQKLGYTICDKFGDYKDNWASVFMTKKL